MPQLVKAEPVAEKAAPKTIAIYTIVADPEPERKKKSTIGD
ncbi:hypothetical protein [Veillonella ratti]|nr:hypothetical protein [Veillonella ratti]